MRLDIHSTSPLTFLVRTGVPCPLLNWLWPSPPHCPLPQASTSTNGVAVPSARSTLKKAKSPPISSCQVAFGCHNPMEKTTHQHRYLDTLSSWRGVLTSRVQPP